MPLSLIDPGERQKSKSPCSNDTQRGEINSKQMNKYNDIEK